MCQQVEEAKSPYKEEILMTSIFLERLKSILLQFGLDASELEHSYGTLKIRLKGKEVEVDENLDIVNIRGVVRN